MRSLQVHGKARPEVSIGPAFCPWPTHSVYGSSLGHWTLGLSLKDRSKSICHFNLDFNPVCKTCSGNPLEVTKNDPKKCVLEIAALLQSQVKVGSVLPNDQLLSSSFVHFFYRTLGHHYVGIICILISLDFHCWGISPKCAAHQTRYSVLVSLKYTRIFWYHVGGLLFFGCFHTDLFECPLPWPGTN